MSTIIDSLSAFLKGKTGFAIVRRTKFGNPCYIKGSTRFYSGALGNFSYIGRNGYFFNTEIGKFSSIADNCSCGMPEHRLDMVSTSQAFLKGGNCLKTTFGTLEHPAYKRTQIGNDVWIGNNVTIRAGLNIGTGAVIGMGSVVTKDVPPYAIVAGNPARIIRYRFDEATIAQLLSSKWWDLDADVIAQLAPFFETPEKLLKKLEEMKSE